MKILCPHCDKPTELAFQVNWTNFGCPHCHTLFEKDPAGHHKQIRLLPKPAGIQSLQLGQQGVLEGKTWEVGGFFIKNPVNEPYAWREYVLYSDTGDTCFLSEYDGHWMLAHEIEDEKFSIQANNGRTYRGVVYPIFHNTKYRTEYAAGFFDHPVAEAGTAKDFARPPHALLLEKSGKERSDAFDARYLPEAELLEAFPDANLPERVGVGMLQPFPVNLEAFFSVLAAAGGIVLLCSILLSGFFPSYRVLDGYMVLTDSLSEEVTHVSPSFTCTGIRAPLQIKLSAPVDNSWVAADFCLINEDTKEERYGSMEVAHYSGYDDGEHWSEGSTSPSIQICGVPPGRYHFVMQVSKMPGRPELRGLHYMVTARVATTANLLMALGLLLAAAVGMILWQSHFERQRWMNSDFPPETHSEY